MSPITEAPHPNMRPKGIQVELPPMEEIQRSPEQIYRAKFAALLIAGRGSSGNTSLAEGVAKLCGIPTDQIYFAGKIVREYDESQNPNHIPNTVGPIERPAAVDESVDNEIVRRIKNSSPEQPQIIEGKMSGYLLRELEKEAKAKGETLPSPRIAILKWAPNKKRLQIARSKKGSITVKEIKAMEDQREADNLLRWENVHSPLKGYKNLLSKSARDDEGKELYQDVIDATKHSTAQEDIDELIEKLLRLDFIEPIEHELTAGEATTIPSQVN